ncbi:hypothetical protein PENVUL_c028G00890 [Penicillium vulpinum]|uniref:Uncharacterized protein n=1 Tax=Penicillium vulpinum TaxID=29845 RepID=A0A1V6RTM5_9EURO|nr:hypothetical protein PENVUL_c028G00890 [Penicillium vulpinum]
MDITHAQSLPTLPKATQASTNYCMYYIKDGDARKNETEALAACCSPNSIQEASQNAQWCEIPDRFFQGLPEPGSDDNQASHWLQVRLLLFKGSSSCLVYVWFSGSGSFVAELGVMEEGNDIRRF